MAGCIVEALSGYSDDIKAISISAEPVSRQYVTIETVSEVGSYIDAFTFRRLYLASLETAENERF